MWASLFPPTCLGCGRLLRHDRALALCTRCTPAQARLPDALAELGSIRASWDYDGPLGRAVGALKFQGALALAGPLGRLLAEDRRLVEDPGGRPIDLVVPIPLHWRRRLARGFDQSEELARWALRHIPPPKSRRPTLAHRVVARRRATQPQTRLDASARARNVEGAFVVRRPALVRGRVIVLLDDVTTTGATARACMSALLEAGASSVSTLALLRAL